MKTVILCRHAESKENVKVRAFKEGMESLKSWSLPSSSQVRQSASLLKINTDHEVSERGRQQIQTVAREIANDEFIKNFDPQIVCHSPLIRARDTCRGLFSEFKEEFLELPCLTEMTPAEIFLFKNRVKIRIEQFEKWLDSRNEERIVVVGHSRYFKVMLNAEEVIDNCSILKCSYIPKTLEDATKNRWEEVELLYSFQDNKSITDHKSLPEKRTDTHSSE